MTSAEFETVVLGANNKVNKEKNNPNESEITTNKVKHKELFNSLYDNDMDKENMKDTGSKLREKMTIAMLGVVIVILLISVTGCVVMWFTDMYNNSLLSKLLLTNGTVALEWWEKPPVSPLLRVHIFNYTNVDRYVAGLDPKLRVEDVGPYVYTETLSKVNIQFNEDETITYNERRISEFLPELSNGKQYDTVVVPNIPMISAAEFVMDSFIKEFALRTTFSATSATPFKTISAQSILWGYQDELMVQLKKLLTLNGGASADAMDKFGVLMNRNGTSNDTMTIYSGVDDIRKLSVIKSFNSETKLDMWTTNSCNSIDGTDGSQFPPNLLNKKSKLNVFIKDMCRKFPLEYEKEVTLSEGIPAWRYKAPDNVFAHPDVNPENQCYCHIESGTCPPSGLFNATLCSHGASIFLSFPHFYLADKELIESIDGLTPDAELHSTYADIHPRLAFPIDGASRFQINIQLKSESIMKNYIKFPENIILPIVWLEIVPGEISPELREMIYHSTFSVNAIQFSLRFGSLFAFIVSLMVLIIACYCRSRLFASEKDYDLQKSALASNSAAIVTVAHTADPSDSKIAFDNDVQELKIVKNGNE